MASPGTLPPPAENQVYVQVSALNGGSLTLPERLFVTDADPDKRATVPSLCFLIQHPSPPSTFSSSNPTPKRLIFDLGVKRDLTSYVPGMHAHISQRHPINTLPDTAASLRAGGLDPAIDIDTVILSHTHWDHIGTPADFSRATFVVGAGTLRLATHGAPHYPPAMFDANLLQRERTFELPPTNPDPAGAKQQTSQTWTPLPPFPHALDFFADSSLYIIDAPGHLTGHINLLCRLSADRWLYLGGDCCHDPRIITGEKDVAEYPDGEGGTRSVHMDLGAARETLNRVRRLIALEGENLKVEWVVAHDGGWAARNEGVFWPGHL